MKVVIPMSENSYVSNVADRPLAAGLFLCLVVVGLAIFCGETKVALEFVKGIANGLIGAALMAYQIERNNRAKETGTQPPPQA